MTDTILSENFKPGAYPDRPDERDLKYRDVVFGSAPIDWDKGYDVEVELRKLFDDPNFKLKREHQGGSSSCVAQAYTKYDEVLQIVDIEEWNDLSAKSIYEQIFLPAGGAYLRDGADAMINGVALEAQIPSYENGNPPSEAYMRKSTITSEIREDMAEWKALKYRSFGFGNPDLIAMAIRDEWGCVAVAIGSNQGWINWHVLPPKPGETTWGHAIYFVAYGRDEIGKWFEFLNSWGSTWGHDGRGRVYFEEYNMAQNFFSGWTLTDKSNQILMSNVKIIKDQNSPSVGIWLPALSEEALKSLCLNFGIEIPLKPDGSTDWDKWIQGTLILK